MEIKHPKLRDTDTSLKTPFAAALKLFLFKFPFESFTLSLPRFAGNFLFIHYYPFISNFYVFLLSYYKYKFFSKKILPEFSF